MVDKSKPGAAVHNVTIVDSISTWENMSTVMFEYPRLNGFVFLLFTKNVQCLQQEECLFLTNGILMAEGKKKQHKGSRASSMLSDVLSRISGKIPAELANVVAQLHNRGQERTVGKYEL